MKERKNILKESHISKHIALLKGMLYVKNTALCSNIGFSKRDTASFERKVRHVEITRFPLKGGPKVKEVLAKNVPYAREAPKINFDRVFHTKAKTRSKLILEASRPGPLSP